MAVTLRLARHGAKGKPSYRIVAAEKGTKREGRFLEIVGTYNPQTNPPTIALKEERVKHWVGEGAQTTETVRNILRKATPGLVEERTKHKLDKIQASRKARKTRAKSK